MVQMKEHLPLNKKMFLSQLYIPHGSDESCEFTGAKFSFPCLLYIPHGSDERNAIFIVVLYTDWSLYPTWFR